MMLDARAKKKPECQYHQDYFQPSFTVHSILLPAGQLAMYRKVCRSGKQSDCKRIYHG
jgi:hypothetical protein